MRRTCFALALAAAALTAQTPQDDRRLVFSTYLGGDRYDDATAVAVDASGNIFVAGRTESRDFGAKPVGTFAVNAALPKAYLNKYSPDGKQILWSHMIGSNGNTYAYACAVDKQGNVLVAGTTGGSDLALVNPVQSKKIGSNTAFVMKFDTEGKLLFSTYLGGDRHDDGFALAVDSQNNFYLAGRASSRNFPVKNAFQPEFGGSNQDGFIAKFTPDNKLAWASYLGGEGGSDTITAIAIAPDDSVLVTGETASRNMATADVWGKDYQHYHSYVAKLSANGDAVIWFSYISNRSGETVAKAVAVDGAGRVWVGGHTTTKNYATTENAFQKAFAGGRRDGFLLCLAPDGKTADYFSYLGGSTAGQSDPDETVEALAVDARGYVLVTGQTVSTDFPISRNVQPYAGGNFESYLLKLDPVNKQVLYSTFWGGGKREVGNGLAVGPGENVTLVGDTFSEDLPLQHAVRKNIGAATDGFVMRFCEPWPGSWPNNSVNFGHTIGGNVAEPQDLEIYTGCSTHFPMQAVSDQPWLRLRYEGQTAPFKLTFEIVPNELPAGEHKAMVKVTVPAAFYSDLLIPVTLTVVEPPPPPAE